MIILPEQVNKAIRLLQDGGFEAYAVGGCVRDLLMGKNPDDFDITTSAAPKETEKIFANYRIIETGIKHGTVTVLLDGMPLEITTYRTDGEYLDCRRPESVSFSRKLSDDLSRRDFTVNTLCFNETDGLVDMFGGADDIKSGIIRAVGNADERFSQDALRILRGIRFASVLGFKIEDRTSESIMENRFLLENISAERIRAEFDKLICGENALEVLLEYHKVVEAFIPELSALVGCEQNTPYHKYDVFGHSMHALSEIERDRDLRLTMFFHDFGKPECKTTDANGIDHFKGHAPAGEKICRKILRRLKYDNKTIDRVSFLVGIHGERSPKTIVEAREFLSEIGRQNYLDFIKIKRADCRAKADPHSIDEKLVRTKEFYDEIMKNGDCVSLKQLAVNGDDITQLGLCDKKITGKLLRALLYAVMEEKCPNEKSALIDYAKHIAANFA